MVAWGSGPSVHVPSAGARHTNPAAQQAENCTPPQQACNAAANPDAHKPIHSDPNIYTEQARDTQDAPREQPVASGEVRRAVGSGEGQLGEALGGQGHAEPEVEEEASESQGAGEEDLWLDPVERIEYSDLEFTEHLGSGEFGQVCRGQYKGREVAIKQLYWDDTLAPEFVLKDLAREIESFRHLRHKRLVCFIGACLEFPHLCLVTEYMPGGSLHHLLHVRKLRLPLLHGANMCLQLADGVMYLHSQTPCVVHRDLKSQNVVLDLQLNLKLCDFGLTESMERTHITKRNNGGSPRYMAPELFDSKTKITEKVDIWAMACIFIEIFGGALPYDNINTLADLTREMLVHKRTPQLPRSLPEPLKRVIRGCHNFDHRLRPSSRQVFEQLREGKRLLREAGLL